MLLDAKVDLERVANDGNRALHMACNERMADRVVSHIALTTATRGTQGHYIGLDSSLITIRGDSDH